jgi:hypothetical protein
MSGTAVDITAVDIITADIITADIITVDIIGEDIPGEDIRETAFIGAARSGWGRGTHMGGDTPIPIMQAPR